MRKIAIFLHSTTFAVLEIRWCSLNMKCSEFHQEYENVIEIRCLGFKQVIDKVKKFAYAIAYAKNSRTLYRTKIDICADWR
jgi:hypothetical protein